MKFQKVEDLSYTLTFYDENTVCDNDISINVEPSPDDPKYFDHMLERARRGRFESLGGMYGWRYDK